MTTLWFCCGCNFGPFNSDLYDSCINCGKYACSMCTREKVTYNSNTHNHNHAAHGCHESSPYPSVVPIDTAHTLSLQTKTMAATGLGDLHSIRSLSRRMPLAMASPFPGAVQFYTQTYMYICCQCGDGPKVYNNQPRCIGCDHEACGSCTQVK
ncbi:uncharacterized protein N7473_003798 [Penicillium subrubescens]|uniref:Uncharacterized protein n=1 Tax=Penicillium subrubescens TaxID=1316194 RepID=A0A1Q5UB32_9EURO|nr:uncharacterized protein N7473_003798 [Penicillium subrubescens]KAJ5906882.1 hypothetical protein N7473_003798 [Penicillium subrubescens]OKP09688.1 hypothetical protein PENSUB_4959 [Penicillium subrubescens]